jgi:hypothetical protein
VVDSNRGGRSSAPLSLLFSRQPLAPKHGHKLKASRNKTRKGERERETMVVRAERRIHGGDLSRTSRWRRERTRRREGKKLERKKRREEERQRRST